MSKNYWCRLICVEVTRKSKKIESRAYAPFMADHFMSINLTGIDAQPMVAALTYK